MAIEDAISHAPVISTRGWSFDNLLAQSSNFLPVERVSFDSADLLTVIRDSEKNGTPLVIQGFHRHIKWPKSMFTLENFSGNSTSPDISVRNVHDWTDKKIPLADFVTKCRQSPLFSGPGETVRYYGKDAECPREWENWLHNADVIPNKFLPGGSDDVLHSDSDTVSIETLMCYLGIGDTFTPCHKDLCASSGQNLMCYTENDGASFWFMTKSGDAGKVDRYFSSLGQDLDHENHVVTTRELARGNFTVYIVEQKLGDLVLVPPRSCHQVVNYGGITIKTSWSRMTLEGLETALYHELPLYQRVCRFETYRVKSTVHRVLQENVSCLDAMLSRSEEGHPEGSQKVQAIAGPSIDMTELRQPLLSRVSHLLRVYSSILAEELCTTFQKSTLGPAQDTHLVCDFCGCDVFQSFFECQDACFETDGDGFKQHCIICPGCFVEGRTCACSDMKPMQRYDFEKLLALRARGIEILNEAGFQHSFEAKFAE
ncbi:hypothetical protein BJ165DRAFT_1340122 [Panaeolus papilionaceus]|nr:hypothetical protein BJ165DRAFT_1340122 [Panaeolus papilionaceus]